MSPEMMCDPPNIDPREHAIESCHWGACSCHLVRHEGRYYVWMAAAAGRPLVYPMVDEAAARSFLDDWQAANLLHTPWDETVVHVFLLDPGRAPRLRPPAAAPQQAPAIPAAGPASSTTPR